MPSAPLLQFYTPQGFCNRRLVHTTAHSRRAGRFVSWGRRGGVRDAAGLPTRRQQLACGARRLGVDKYELCIGDMVILLAFCLWKQIFAIVASPSFPGWLAPLSVEPLRMVEFLGFTSTILGTWFATSLLSGDYSASSNSSGVRESIVRASRTWLISMPVVAAQLVLATCAESQSLVGDGFATKLPLAASGHYEPIVSASTILGLMAIWRSLYAVFLDWTGFTSISYSRSSREQEAAHFVEALRVVAFMAFTGCVLAIVGLAADRTLP